MVGKPTTGKGQQHRDGETNPLMHSRKTILGSESNTEMWIGIRLGIHNQGTKTNFSNWSVLGNKETVLWLIFFGSAYFLCKYLQTLKSTAIQNQYSSMTSRCWLIWFRLTTEPKFLLTVAFFIFNPWVKPSSNNRRESYWQVLLKYYHHTLKSKMKL